MPAVPGSWALFAVVALFVLFVIIKLRVPLAGLSPKHAEARRRLGEIKRRAREARSDGHQRARAFREAAQVALEDLGRPNLAASYARRAERADPEDAAAIGAVALAMRRANRFRALEKLLWRRLAALPPGPAHDRAFDELLSLCEGPLRRPEQAAVLRRLRDGASRPGGVEGT